MDFARDQAIDWLAKYGYWATVPALLADPAGVPWFWIFLMLLAEKAGRSLTLLFALGMGVVMAFDHLLYWIGAIGGRPLMNKLAQRWPGLACGIDQAEKVMLGRGAWAIALGRFLPLVGRYVGVAAGLIRVPYSRFAFYDAIGAAITVVGFGLVAHFVGEKTIDQPWFPAVLVITFVGSIVLTSAAIFVGLWRRRCTMGPV